MYSLTQRKEPLFFLTNTSDCRVYLLTGKHFPYNAAHRERCCVCNRKKSPVGKKIRQENKKISVQNVKFTSALVRVLEIFTRNLCFDLPVHVAFLC